jgi:hypothetical protein
MTKAERSRLCRILGLLPRADEIGAPRGDDIEIASGGRIRIADGRPHQVRYLCVCQPPAVYPRIIDPTYAEST